MICSYLEFLELSGQSILAKSLYGVFPVLLGLGPKKHPSSVARDRLRKTKTKTKPIKLAAKTQNKFSLTLIFTPLPLKYIVVRITVLERENGC